jgi:hypothetical protein
MTFTKTTGSKEVWVNGDQLHVIKSLAQFIAGFAMGRRAGGGAPKACGFRPQAHNPDKPVVVVQHGMSRNGAEYCEAWLPAAGQHGLPIVAITFPREA